MRPKTTLPFAFKSWMIALLIGLILIGLAYGVRTAIEGAGYVAPHSWFDLALLLCGYLFLFCLKPLQRAVQRRLRRRTTQKTAR